MSEKFILTVKSFHLGHIKETFGLGSVIEHDEVNKRLIVDGRKFDDTRDLDILKRQAAKDPEHAWIVPFDEELLAEIRGSKPVAPPPAKPRPGENMQIIKSDSDLTEPIDIRNTQVSKINNAAKEAARNKVKAEGMPIIRGDETVQERLAQLKDKTDINSMAERVRLKREGGNKMPIVQDDSLGTGVSRTATPLNAGQSLPSRDSIDAKAEEAKAMADARKKDVESRRKAAGVEVPSENVVAPEAKAPAAEVPAPAPVMGEGVVGIEMGSDDSDASKEGEIAALKAKIASLEAAAQKSVRRPVTTAERAKEILGKK